MERMKLAEEAAQSACERVSQIFAVEAQTSGTE